MVSYHFRNEGPQLVILRCIDSGSFFLEKVIFPRQGWCFDSPPGTRVEIWTYGPAGVELLNAMNAEELQHSGRSDPEWGLDQQRPVHQASLGGVFNATWPSRPPQRSLSPAE